MVVIVNGWVHVETAPSVSVTVQDAEPATGPVEAATPEQVAVTPSVLRTTVAEGSEKEYTTFDSVPPEGVTPSARKVTGEACEVCPTARVRALFAMVVDSPDYRGTVN